MSPDGWQGREPRREEDGMSAAPSERPSDEDIIRPATRTFFGAPPADSLERLDAQVAFLGVPWDQGVIIPFIRSGAYAGPRLVRETRTRLRDTRPDGTSAGWFDIEAEREFLAGVRMADCGDVLVAGGDVALSHERITTATRRISERGALLVAVGGDHSVSFPVGRGVAEVHETVDVVHIDAHADFADAIYGSRFQHGSQLRRLFELPTVDRITALGLRSVDREQYEDLRRLGVDFASTATLLDEGPAAVVERLVRPNRNLYVSIDIDVLDAALVPATTLPEPGGLAYRQLRALLEAIARRGKVVGFDIVETSAAQPDLATPMTTAWLIVHFLTAIFEGGSATA
jgi:agmatinase